MQVDQLFESGLVVQKEMLFKDASYLIYSSGCLFVWGSGPVCAFLVEGIMRNISVK